jgi:hypothetical protein
LVACQRVPAVLQGVFGNWPVTVAPALNEQF